MFIFTRIRTIDPGRVGDAMTLATETSGMVRELTGLTGNTWYQTFAPTGPAIMWTARLEHFEELDRAFETLRGSEAYLDRLAELDEHFVGPTVDNLFEVVAGTPPATPSPIVSMVQATAVNGHLRAAMHWGADLAERFGRSMDVPTIFVRGLYGDYGSMAWGTYFDDINALEGTHAKLTADEMLQAVMDEGAHNCREGAIATVARRLD
ncbi:MAG: hypothetical protein OEV40_10810 [Acidimicrobiia bacterium]|nr:hypothetical protein [Acidimicrobiia bacterium]